MFYITINWIGFSQNYIWGHISNSEAEKQLELTIQFSADFLRVLQFVYNCSTLRKQIGNWNKNSKTWETNRGRLENGRAVTWLKQCVRQCSV